MNQAYLNGFIKRAAEYGFSQDQALTMAKEAFSPLQSEDWSDFFKQNQGIAGAGIGGLVGGGLGALHGAVNHDEHGKKKVKSHALMGAIGGAGLGGWAGNANQNDLESTLRNVQEQKDNVGFDMSGAYQHYDRQARELKEALGIR